MDIRSKIFVAGHSGLVGSAICRELRAQGYGNLVLRRHAELDLCDQAAVAHFFATERPDYVFLAAARVGGIARNAAEPADFIRENLQISVNCIDSAYRHGVAKFLNLGSACIYPKVVPQPIREDTLLTAPLEPTNDAYAIAKIAAVMMCQKYTHQYGWPTLNVMPTNLYGPGDNFHPFQSHVIPGLIQKFHAAKMSGAESVTCWGDGSPTRDFMHVDDMAHACVWLMQHHNDPEIINVATGHDVSIAELARRIAEVVGFEGHILWDTSKPNGTPLRQLDVSRLNSLGWTARIALTEGLRSTYRWFLDHAAAPVVKEQTGTHA